MLKLKKILFVFIAIICIVSPVISQSPDFKGEYPVKYYSNEDFNSPDQIWSVTQGANNIMLFGNQQKIIKFDGKDWSLLKNQIDPNNLDSLVRDEVPVKGLFRASDGTIYVGRDGSFGHLKYNAQGLLVYQSLLIDNGIEKLYNIFETEDNTILFISEKKIYYKNDQKIDSLILPKDFEDRRIKNATKINNGILISLGRPKIDSFPEAKQITYFYNESNKSFSKVNFNDDISLTNVRGAFNIGGNTYVADKVKGIFSFVYSNGMFQWSELKQGMFEEVVSRSINCVQRREGLIYFGTESSGVFVYNLKGELIYELNEKDGLINQDVFNIYFDYKGDLWMVLDNGIVVVEFSSPLTFWTTKEGVKGSGEAIDFNKDHILLATRSGLFKSNSTGNQVLFEKNEGFTQAAFDIKTFDTDFGRRTLIVGYNGLYELLGNNETKSIALSVYAWEFYQNPLNRNEVFVGGEDFLGKLTITDGNWSYANLFDEESNIISMVSSGEDLYYGVNGQGVKRLNLISNEVTLIPIRVKEAEKKSFSIYLENFQDKIIVGLQNGLYQVENGKLTPVLCENFEFNIDETKGVTVHRLYNQKDEKLWMEIVKENENNNDVKLFGFLEKGDNGQLVWQEIVNPTLTQSGIINDIVGDNNGGVYAISGKGLYRIKHKEDGFNNAKFKIYIEKIKSGDSVLVYNTDFAENIKPVLHGKPIRFFFASEGYSSQGLTLYRTKMEGYSDKWSEWSDLNFKEYEKLSHGEYTFRVQAKNFYGVESEIKEYTFSIVPPWYFTWWAYLLYALILMGIIFGVSYISTQRVKAQNKRLEETVQLRTQEIEQQKDEIAAKSEDILDSIVYAKRIQDTILPDQVLLEDSFKDHFVLFKPKDIVSGDFYWAKKIDNTILWSAIDCTGHGVPGAFVSIVGNNGLLRSVNEFKAAEPASILNKLRDIVIESFESQADDVKDGMDIALCSYDKSENVIQFSGANNPCVIIRNGEVLETKADKQPIGAFTAAKPFTNHSIEVMDGDCVYLYTDGYVDQFGGVKNKKLKSRPFKNFLVDIHQLPMKEQHAKLESFFEEWRGENEQIDDVCIFGVRI